MDDNRIDEMLDDLPVSPFFPGDGFGFPIISGQKIFIVTLVLPRHTLLSLLSAKKNEIVKDVSFNNSSLINF